ncbi:unnamed protein product [Adineta steineri]|uniref:Uncharacterized protein n=1 Tax=Adineta steineri TaxID=433720 RepID=A0A815TYL7_9BILA|nr:unnamed protein product [Adineta steineri]
MDESPLALFGDQAKRSINDINTCNEVEGCLSNKRFCTVILTVSGEDQRVDPVLLFKGKGHISPNEQKQYANGIKVTLQNYTYDSSVINCVSLNINDDDDEEQIQNAATLAAEQHKITLNEKKTIKIN